MRRRARRLATLGVCTGLVISLAACGSGGGQTAAKPDKAALFAPGSDISYTKYGADYPATTVKDVPGRCSYETISTKDYSGIDLKVLAPSVPVMGEPAQLHAKQFAEITGANVAVENVPFGELYAKLLTPLQAGQPAYDAMFYPSLWIGDVAPYLAPVPQEYLDTSGMRDVTPSYLDVATWDGTVVQFPVDGDRHYLKLRSDLLADPANRTAFRAATGRDLTPPRTWEEYQQVAQFFTGRPFPGGGTGYGSAEVTKRDDLLFSAFISRAAAYAKNPNVKGGFFFDVETMTPQVNNAGFVKALDMFKAAESTWPPGGSNFGLGDEILSFGGGQTALSYSWDDAFIQAQQPDSPIRNSVQAAQLPGSTQVWNRATNSWDTPAAPNTAAYFTWGWTSAVAASTPDQAAAFDLLCFFSNEANTALDLQIGRFGVNPYRTSHFEAPTWESQGWATPTAQTYVQTFADMEANPNRVFDLRVPGVQQYMSALATGVAAALAGEKSSQQALDEVAAEWNRITEQVGRDQVQSAYRTVVALEDGTG